MRIKVGLVGTSQLSFPGPKEKVYAEMVEQMKVNAEEMKFDFVYYPDQVIVAEDALKAVKFMEEEKVDFLMILNVSYSAGFLVPILYKIKNANVGIWAIPEPLEGVVMFNSFCSNNMYQGINDKYLAANNIKSKWFYGYANDERFKRRLYVTVKALQAIKRMKNSRVALIGGVAPGFYDLYFDERSVLAKFDGMYLDRNHEYQEIIDLANEVTDEDIQSYLEDLKGIEATKNAEHHKAFSLKLYLAYKKFVEKHNYDALAVSCWPKFQDDYKYSVCSVMGMLNDDKVVAACEGDLMSAISMLILQEISDESTSLMDFSAFDEKDDSVLLWHCGPGSIKFCKKNGYRLGENYSGAPHPEGEIRGLGVARDMEFDPLPAQIFRFSGDMESYINLTGDFIGNTKKSNCGSRGWLHNLKLNDKPIKAIDFTNTILAGGFEHHYPVAIGQYSAILTEMCKWLDIKPLKEIKYADYLQDRGDEE